MPIGLNVLVLCLVDLLIDLRYFVLDVPDLQFDSFALIRRQLLMGDLVLQILKDELRCNFLLNGLDGLILLLSQPGLDFIQRSTALLHLLLRPKQQFSFLLHLFLHHRQFFLRSMMVSDGHSLGFHRIGKFRVLSLKEFN